MDDETKKKVDEMHKVLCGTPLKGEPGLIHTHKRLLLDFYGPDPDDEPDRGYKGKTDKIVEERRDEKLKARWLATGFGAGAGLATSGVGLWIAKVIGWFK